MKSLKIEKLKNIKNEINYKLRLTTDLYFNEIWFNNIYDLEKSLMLLLMFENIKCDDINLHLDKICALFINEFYVIEL